MLLRRRRAISVAVAASLLAGGLVSAVVNATSASAASLPAEFSEQIVIRGLNQPTNIEFAPDGRIFVAEKAGVIKVFDGLNDTTPTEFADLSPQVLKVHDAGLLGMALHPSFPAEPWVYVLYTRDALPGGTAPQWRDRCENAPANRCVTSSRLSRLDANGTEQVLIDSGWCQQGPSHSVGDLRFGRDGMLYVTHGDGARADIVDYGQTPRNAPNPCGDPPGGAMTPPRAEGGALRAQDVRTPNTAEDPTGLNGALLRLDPVTGDGAPGNPGAGSPDLNTRRIIAHGLRNAFRFDIRPGTDEVWLADVGWNTVEEINVVSDATTLTNFGWPCYEGPDRQAGYDGANLDLCENLYREDTQTAPRFHFRHDQTMGAPAGDRKCGTGGSAWSGVAFYPTAGGNYPPEYQGAMFLADYTRKCIWVLPPSEPGGPPITTTRPEDVKTFVFEPATPVDLAIGPGGDLFYVDYGMDPNSDSGTVRRIVYTGANTSPTAVLSATPTAGAAPLTVAFDAANSTDPDGGDGGRLSYEWDFTDDGTVDATTVTASHTYPDEGSFTARLRVRDGAGGTDTKTVVISVGNAAPTATIDAPVGTTTWAVGDTLSFAGGATDPEQGQLPAAALRWQLIQHHCYTLDSCHQHVLQEWEGVAEGSFTAPEHEYPSYLELVLTATDAGGLQQTSRRRLDPKTVELTFVTDPPGLTISVGSAAEQTPFTRTVIQNSTNTVSAVTPQTVGADVFTFREWSDGGEQTHVVTAPATPTTLTAAFDRTVTATPTVATAKCTPGESYGAPLDSAAQRAGLLAGGFNFLEGPVWIAGRDGNPGRLLVSDMQRPTVPGGVEPSVIRSMTPAGVFAVFRADGGSNGLALSADGTKVFAATHDQQSVSSYSLADGTRGVVAASVPGRQFNSPNDLTVRGDGTVYFTDPSFQRANRAGQAAGLTNVYRVKDDVVSVVDDTVKQPNGIVLSPDEQTLYVAGGDSGRIYRYPVRADGSVGPRTEFAEVTSPDGGTVDCAGNLYWASHTQGLIHVFAPDGRKLGTIAAGDDATNAAFGGPDGKTLFITSGIRGNYGVYSIDLNVPGLPY
ncbi:MAG TPA: SMP-30/gluconolactonase/LRE family protein [Micromonosporaceae bacterium]|nr:SMP-30/gluconolactonase/LRE family protein [Micromonosporaceae bacterium]